MIGSQSVKVFGLAVGALLFCYAVAIGKMERYSDVDDKYASGLSTVGLLVSLVALGGFTGPPANQLLEAGGYSLAAIGGTFAFHRIITNPKYFKEA